MAHCDFIETCPFLHNKIIDMPITSCNLVESYCYGAFATCSIHKAAMTHGIDKIPKDISPEDTYELSDDVIESVLLGRVGW